MRTLIFVFFLLPASAWADTSSTFYSVTCVPALSSAHVDTFRIADADDYVFPLSGGSGLDDKVYAAQQFKEHEENMRQLAAGRVYAYGKDNGALYLANPVECVMPNFTLRMITRPVKGNFLNGGRQTFGDKPIIEIEMNGRVVFSETLDETESLFADGHFAALVALTRCVDEPSSTNAGSTYRRVCKQHDVRP